MNQLQEIQSELAAAQSFFDNADPERETEAILRLKAAEERQNSFFRRMKNEFKNSKEVGI